MTDKSLDQSKSRSMIRTEESSDLINLNKTTISDDVIKNAPELILEELEGDQLLGNKLIINAGGLVSGARKARDGFAFFGTVYKNVKINKK
jgi:hypothetical protein